LINKEFGKELEKGTKEFEIQIIKQSNSFPYSIEKKVFKNQLIISGTSIGANY
jgi:four helix bundle protein